NRGYKDSTELTKHAIAKLPDRPVSNRYVISDDDLFDKRDNAKLKSEKGLKKIGSLLERASYDLIVVAGYLGMQGDAEENLILTQARALVVREYLVDHFKVDDRKIKTIGMGENTATGSTPAARVEILVYSAPSQTLQKPSKETR